jgi:hypothetical protein
MAPDGPDSCPPLGADGIGALAGALPRLARDCLQPPGDLPVTDPQHADERGRRAASGSCTSLVEVAIDETCPDRRVRSKVDIVSAWMQFVLQSG